MSRLTRDGTTEPVSRGQILRRERGKRKVHFLCSADHEQDWHPPPVDPYSFYTWYVMTMHPCYTQETMSAYPKSAVLIHGWSTLSYIPHCKFTVTVGLIKSVFVC